MAIDSLELQETKPSLSKAFGATDRGRRRETNEDAVLIYDSKEKITNDPEKILSAYAVADGVGGRNHGEIASDSLVRSVFRKVSSTNQKITIEDLFTFERQIPKGATTLTLAQGISQNRFEIFSVGDSSALLIDVKNNSLNELLQRDETSDGKVTQAMGPQARQAAPLRRPNRTVIEIGPGQTLLLATDGFTRYLDSRKISKERLLAVRQHFSKDEIGFVKELIRIANSLGGSDNIAVVSIPYER